MTSSLLIAVILLSGLEVTCALYCYECEFTGDVYMDELCPFQCTTDDILLNSSNLLSTVSGKLVKEWENVTNFKGNVYPACITHYNVTNISKH